jgi:cell division septation protein DedD
MATDPNRDEFLEDDEQDELARRSIFSAGWFRALLVLTVLAIVVVVSLPYLLNWLEPTPAPPPAKTQAKNGEPAPAPSQPPVASPSPPTMIPGPAAPAPTTATPPAPTPSLPTPSAKLETPAPRAPAPSAPTPSAKGETPKSAPTPAPPSPADRPLGTAPLPVVPAPSGPVAKTGPAAKQVPSAKAPTAPKQVTPVEGGSSGSYFVQVGAFLEEKNAEALAKQIRGESFPVQISQVTRGGGAASSVPAKPSGGQNQLFITGSTPDAVNAALKGKGTAQAVKGGIVVNPPFDLETAMSLSSALKQDGFKVVIRRAKGPAPPPRAGGGPTYHVVRVGGYPDRAKAQQARTELEAKGHPGFLSQGAAR